MEWKHFTERVNGVNIHFVAQGEGEPVILLHGWPEFWYSWRNQLPVLGESYRAIAPDMRGFGYSDKPLSGYDTRTAASDMYELARALGYEQVRLVAHDIGARVAFRFTLDHPEAVRKLALIDSTPPIEQLGNQPPAAIRERWHSYFHQQLDLPEKLIEGREEIYLRHIFRDWCINKYPISDEDVAHYVKAYSQPGALRGGFSYYRAAAYEDPPDWRADAERQLDTPDAVPVRGAAVQDGGGDGDRASGGCVAEVLSQRGGESYGELWALFAVGDPGGGEPGTGGVSAGVTGVALTIGLFPLVALIGRGNGGLSPCLCRDDGECVGMNPASGVPAGRGYNTVAIIGASHRYRTGGWRRWQRTVCVPRSCGRWPPTGSALSPPRKSINMWPPREWPASTRRRSATGTWSTGNSPTWPA